MTASPQEFPAGDFAAQTGIHLGSLALLRAEIAGWTADQIPAELDGLLTASAGETSPVTKIIANTYDGVAFQPVKDTLWVIHHAIARTPRSIDVNRTAEEAISSVIGALEILELDKQPVDSLKDMLEVCVQYANLMPDSATRASAYNRLALEAERLRERPAPADWASFCLNYTDKQMDRAVEATQQIVDEDMRIELYTQIAANSITIYNSWYGSAPFNEADTANNALKDTMSRRPKNLFEQAGQVAASLTDKRQRLGNHKKQRLGNHAYIAVQAAGMAGEQTHLDGDVDPAITRELYVVAVENLRQVTTEGNKSGRFSMLSDFKRASMMINLGEDLADVIAEFSEEKSTSYRSGLIEEAANLFEAASLAAQRANRPVGFNRTQGHGVLFNKSASYRISRVARGFLQFKKPLDQKDFNSVKKIITASVRLGRAEDSVLNEHVEEETLRDLAKMSRAQKNQAQGLELFALSDELQRERLKPGEQTIQLEWNALEMIQYLAKETKDKVSIAPEQRSFVEFAVQEFLNKQGAYTEFTLKSVAAKIENPDLAQQIIIKAELFKKQKEATSGDTPQPSKTNAQLLAELAITAK